jgi:hypothetical protein
MEHIRIGNNFMNGTPITQQLRKSIHKWDSIKLNTFIAKEIVTRLKRQPTEWKKIFMSFISENGLIIRV